MLPSVAIFQNSIGENQNRHVVFRVNLPQRRQFFPPIMHVRNQNAGIRRHSPIGKEFIDDQSWNWQLCSTSWYRRRCFRRNDRGCKLLIQSIYFPKLESCSEVGRCSNSVNLRGTVNQTESRSPEMPRHWRTVDCCLRLVYQRKLLGKSLNPFPIGLIAHRDQLRTSKFVKQLAIRSA